MEKCEGEHQLSTLTDNVRVIFVHIDELYRSTECSKFQVLIAHLEILISAVKGLHEWTKEEVPGR